MGVAPRRQAHPLTVSELAQIVSRIDTDHAIGIRDRAIILLGYASAMRPGEISAPDVEDIMTKPTGILISVRRSKTDQDGQGQLVGVARGDNPVTDPIRALDAWLMTRPAGPGALFTRVVYPRSVTTERIGPPSIQQARPAAGQRSRIRGHPGHGPLAACRPRHDRRCQRCPDRPDRRPDPAPRPRHPPQPLHPTGGGTRAFDQSRPRPLTGLAVQPDVLLAAGRQQAGSPDLPRSGELASVSLVCGFTARSDHDLS